MDTPWLLLHLGAAGVLLYALLLLRQYMRGGKYTGTERIPGKTVIVTGANTGIGKETARVLASRGGRVILACRDLKRGEGAREDIVASTGNENVAVKQLDLASLQSIRAFAKDVNADEEHIDILINNAGVMYCPKMLTEDGFEMQLGVNHMGHFLLTNLLLDKMKSSAPSRIVNVSSLGHTFLSGMNFDDLNSEKSYDRFKAYSQSKLANILFTRHLAAMLEGSGVTVNALHPGVVETELARHLPLVDNPLVRFLTYPLVWLLMKTPSDGAQTSLHLALADDLQTVTGKYFSDCREKEPSKAAQDDDAAKKLWEMSQKWTKLD